MRSVQYTPFCSRAMRSAHLGLGSGSGSGLGLGLGLGLGIGIGLGLGLGFTSSSQSTRDCCARASPTCRRPVSLAQCLCYTSVSFLSGAKDGEAAMAMEEVAFAARWAATVARAVLTIAAAAAVAAAAAAAPPQPQWPFDAWRPSRHHCHHLGTRSGPLRSVCIGKGIEGVACNCGTIRRAQLPP